MAMLPVHVRYVKHGDCEITVDGWSITSAVKEMTFHAEGEDVVGTLTLSLCAPVLEVDGKQQVKIDPRTHVALVALGWTPPEDVPEPVDDWVQVRIPPPSGGKKIDGIEGMYYPSPGEDADDAGA